VELVRAFHAAYKQLGLNGRIVGTDIDPLAPAMQEVDVPIIVPRHTDSCFIQSLVDTCRGEEISAVFPLIDPDIPLLAEHRDCIEAVGAEVVVVGRDAAQVCGDKWATNSFFRKIGIACPRSWINENLSRNEIEFPLFVKPRNGSAAVDTYKINNERELDFFREYVSDPIFQEFLPGPEITSDIVCDFKGRLLSIVSRQRIAVRGGEVVKGFTIFDERINDACEQIASSLPAVGPITVQCMMKDDMPHFIEINGRLGGGVPLAIAAGIDVPAMLLDLSRGRRVNPCKPGEYVHGLHITRFDQSFFTTTKGSLVEAKSNRI